MLLRVQKESLRYAFCATGCFANKIIEAAIFEEIKSDYLMLISFRLHKYKSNLFKALKMGFKEIDLVLLCETGTINVTITQEELRDKFSKTR